jgi:hypothetical protein
MTAEGLKKRPDDVLYQAETSRLKNLYCKVVYDCVLNDIHKFILAFGMLSKEGIYEVEVGFWSAVLERNL